MCEQRAAFEKILKRVQTTIDSEISKADDCISLYDVAQLIINKYNQYDEEIKSYGIILEANMGREAYSIIVYDFDYEKNEVKIGISTERFGDYKHIQFSKYNEDLFISSSEVYNDFEVMDKCGDTISKMYDEFEKFREFKTQSKYRINTLNSKYIADISYYGVGIYTGNHYEFKLLLRSYKKGYECICNSHNIQSTVQGNEEKIFKRVFVKIEDCPEWAQPILREIRQEQLKPKSKEFFEEKIKESRQERTENLERKKPELLVEVKPKVSSQYNSRQKSGILSDIKKYFKDMYRMLNGEEIS